MVIAHRLSTIRRANRIAVLEDGRITAIGSHEELLTTSPTYQRLYQLQFMDMPESLDPANACADAICTGVRAGSVIERQRSSKMPIYSMTGFARVQVRVPATKLSLHA